MSKHTPGPWTFTSEQILDDGIPIHDEIRCFHLQSGDTVILDGCGCCDSPRLWNPANARLIAAAPDLLEALETLLSDQRDASLPALVKARAAIAKAKAGYAVALSASR